ncbi:MAG TPA: AAA family ATPase [Gemmatimonadaceae bacterium]|jgi:DNA-binding NarL/FixJ family response regulator
MNRLTSPPGATTPGIKRGHASEKLIPLTGRGPELAVLAGSVQNAEDGRGGTVIIAGESGIGKTRLANAVAEQATKRGFSVAVGRAYPVEAGVPYAVFSDALLPLLRQIDPSMLSLLTRGGNAELVQLFPALATGDKPLRSNGVRGDPSELRARLLWNFTQFLSRFAAKRPLLLVLDNLQWADSSSLELLHFTARQIAHDRILIVATYNDADSRSGSARSVLKGMESSLAELGVAQAMHMAPLDIASTRELVQQLLGESAARELAELIHQRTRGNPLFVEETAKALAEEMASGGERAPTAQDLQALKLPRTIHDVVIARLGQLSTPARQLADLAAVIGTRSSHDALAFMSQLPQDALLTALDELRTARVIDEHAESGEIVYDFTHPLLQEALYAELGLARARALHAVVAESLEAFYGAAANGHVNELAFHYLRADARRLAEKAVQYLHAAGMDAMAKHANREAADYLAAALEQLERLGAVDDERSIAVAHDLARARQRLGEYPAALTLWRRAAEDAEKRGLHSRLATIRRNMGMVSYWSGRHEEALSHYDAAIAAAIAAGEPAVEARTLIAKGMCLQGLGRRDESERVVHLALDIAERLGDAALLARVHRALLLLYVWTGPPQLARKHGARAIVLAEQSGQRGVEWSAHWALAMLGGLTASVEDIAHHLAEAQRLADELRSPLLRAWTAEVTIEYYAGIGEWDTAVTLAEATLAVARSLGQSTLIPRLLVWLGLLYFGRGNVEGGKACVDEAWELSGAGEESARGDVHSIVPAHTGRAAYHLTMQDYETAIRTGERGLEIADASGYVVWAVHRLMPVIAEAALWKSDMRRALRVGQRLRRDAGRLDHRLGLAWADASVALAELLQGNKSRSVEMLRTVAEQLEAIPYVPDAARVRRQLARALAETGDREGATRELRRAHEVFARLGAEPELKATREQLRELGARPPVRSHAEGAAGLTGRELEIVRLVADRQSNKEIGAALDISSRTVSTHLSNIFSKLGLTSRGELADYARTSGLLNDT